MCQRLVYSGLFRYILIDWIGGVSLCERLAGVLGHYGGHTRPQVADRGMPSRSGTRG